MRSIDALSAQYKRIITQFNKSPINMEIQTKFNAAIKTILRHEGGFVDRPHDRGGPTNYGISLRFLKENNIDINSDGVIDIEDVRALTVLKATEIYKEYFWDKYHYAQIDSVELATKIFDLGVNMGAHEAHEITQRTINKLLDLVTSFIFSPNLLESARTFAKQPKLIEDGILGQKSIAAINEIAKLDRVTAFLEWFNWEATLVFHEIVQIHPEDQENLAGWLNRLKN